MYNNHAMFLYKDEGMSRKLRGNVLIDLIFVQDPCTDWKQSEMDKFYNVYEDAINGIGKQAVAARVPLTFISRVSRYTYSDTLNPANFSSNVTNDVYNQYIRARGDRTHSEYISNRKRKYNADELAIIFVFERSFRAYAVSGDNVEFSVLTEDNNAHAIAHELLHLFGAADMYYPYQVYGLTMKYFPESIMCTYNGMEIDPLTQYLIGWKTTLPLKANEYVNKLSDFSVERYARANELEIYRENEKYLFDHAIPFRSLSDIEKHSNAVNPWAEYLLGLCYRDGIFVQKNLKKAEEFFRRSGRTGLTIAAVEHAQIIVSRGLYSSVDVEELWLISNYNGYNHLKLNALRIACLQKGLGTHVDEGTAAGYAFYEYEKNDYYKNQIRRSEWFYAIAEKYSTNIPELRNLVSQLRSEYEKMSREGDRDLYFIMARLYEQGKYVSRSLPKAFDLYMHSARLGNYRACQEVARFYEQGIAVKRDLSSSRRFLTLASNYRNLNPNDPFCRII